MFHGEEAMTIVTKGTDSRNILTLSGSYFWMFFEKKLLRSLSVLSQP